MAKYLVTGGCGFIGSHLVDRLIASNHEVVVLDNLSTGKIENLSPKAELVVGDVLDGPLVQKLLSQMQGCFHLAAIVGIPYNQDHWVAANNINLGGTVTIFDAARRARKDNPIPIVYPSSCAVYGHCEHLPLHETLFIRPISSYGADKLGCELQANAAWCEHRIPNVGLRLFNVYGPRQDPSSSYSGVISKFIAKIDDHEAVLIYGDGKQTRDFIYVADVIDAFIFFMENISETAEVYNICTGNSVTINDLVQIFSEIYQRPVEKIYSSKRTGDVLYSCGDPSKAAKIGYRARYTMKEGLSEMLKR
ncbi:MAG: NAD-dependent epimerase/dehydratase family protein [Gammaproteobacteria bacterium]|nr:NAD-dependent epimerase/dehydratase family protein [Gammaproteobacteria bacterium]